MICTDQIGNTVQINKESKHLRIVSLVPSQTELLYYLGANVVGQTIFCVHPENVFKEAVKIGGTKRLNIDKILSLKPDLIIGNKEENERSQIEELSKHFPTWVSDIFTLEDALDMIGSLGLITGNDRESNILKNNILLGFNKLNSSNIKTRYAAYVIWKDPIMIAGRNTFINDLMTRCGLTNVCKDDSSRYPEISLAKLQEHAPEYLLLSTEPFPFKEEHVNFFQENLPDTKVVLVDGEYFSWYGNRLLGFPEYVQKELPELLRS